MTISGANYEFLELVLSPSLLRLFVRRPGQDASRGDLFLGLGLMVGTLGCKKSSRTTVTYHLTPTRIITIQKTKTKTKQNKTKPKKQNPTTRKTQVLARMWRNWNPTTLLVGMKNGAAAVENSMTAP